MKLEETQGLMRVVLRQVSNTEEVPVVAAVFNKHRELISVACNSVLQSADPTSHAEMNCIRDLSSIQPRVNLSECILVCLLEPCPMCATAISFARFGGLIFGAGNPRFGAGGSVYDILRDSRVGAAIPTYGYVLSDECSEILGSFFRRLRDSY